MAWLCALAAALAIGVVIAMFRVMSVAFTREEDLEATAADLADRPISPHPNLVTPEGLAAIEAELASARAAYTAAQVQGSIESDRTAMARATRDLRYWSARRASAQLIAPTEDDGAVRFGGSVSIEREDGRAQTWRIVGEDEADPAAGSVSHVSPLARAVMGKRVGDEVTVAGQSAEIVAVG
ncbi:MAG: transcription elongation GreA/GreB family factor [Brevundimonas sp.]|jgi:transcription elongation GreA/GreB family factor